VPIPAAVREMVVRTCAPEDGFEGCAIIFSGLDHDVAGDIGELGPAQRLATRLLPTN
jgi:aspartate-semialdehyde dehydrogenase